MSDKWITAYIDASQSLKKGDVLKRIVSDRGAASNKLVEIGEELEKKLLEIQALSLITRKINEGMTLQEVLNLVFDSFKTIIPYSRIGFSLIEDSGEIVCSEWLRSEAPIIKLEEGYSAPLKGSSLERIIETGQPRIINDLKVYLKEKPGSDSTKLIVEEGMCSSLTCPLISQGKAIGFVFFSSMQAHTYDNLHADLFLQIAGQLSTIVEKSRMFDEVVHLNELKNKFIGMAAHDLRNPLNNISGYVSLLLQGITGEMTEQQTEMLERVRVMGNNMALLINDFLNISVIESGHLSIDCKPYELKGYLAKVLQDHELLAKAKSIGLKLEVPDRLPKVTFDGHRIMQVFGNLISNAIKYSNPDTVITVSVEPQDDEIVFSVADQGQGIPEDEIGKLFSDFSKTSVKPTAGETSSGLGLAICRRLVEAHQGKIWVESEEGQGSVFKFSIPLTS